MEMQTIHSGRLRAIGYDASRRRLRIRFDDGSLMEYAGIGQEIWRRLAAAASPWSVYRDNIEEEFQGVRVADETTSEQKKNPLDDLFS
jgi:hypothetical protein